MWCFNVIYPIVVTGYYSGFNVLPNLSATLFCGIISKTSGLKYWSRGDLFLLDCGGETSILINTSILTSNNKNIQSLCSLLPKSIMSKILSRRTKEH